MRISKIEMLEIDNSEKSRSLTICKMNRMIYSESPMKLILSIFVLICAIVMTKPGATHVGVLKI